MKLKDLSAEFPRDAIHWRAQTLTRNGDKALALAYLDARDVMDRLDDVCGPENWQSRYVETAKGRVLCEIGIKIGDEWVWKSDGAGDTAVEGEKGGISDALKRAAVQWGIGRYLYRLDAVWAPCETYEKQGKAVWKAWKGSPWDHVRQKPKPRAKPETSPLEVEAEESWFANTLPNVKDADGINALLPRAKAAGREVQQLVVQRANALGLEFDAIARRYVYLEQADDSKAEREHDAAVREQ